MRRFAHLLGVSLLAVLATAGCTIAGQPCGWFNVNACDQPPAPPMCPAQGTGGGAGEGGGAPASCGMQDDYCTQDSDCCPPDAVCSLNGCQLSNDGSAAQPDCPATMAGIPLPKPAKWVGLDTGTLKTIAIANNVNKCANLTGIAQNRAIGIAFETWVLKTNGQLSKRWRTPIFSQERKNRTGSLPASVIPEFVDTQTTFSFDILSVTLTWNYFPNSMFYEVKAITGNLTLGTSQWQILGLLDVATTFPTIPTTAHAPPGVVFNTTSNTVVTQPVVDQGTAWGVGVWQGTVYYDANSATPNNPKLRLGDPVCLNTSLYPMSKPNVLLSLYWIDPSSWADNPLTWPTQQDLDNEPVAGDPDPPAVN